MNPKPPADQGVTVRDKIRAYGCIQPALRSILLDEIMADISKENIALQAKLDEANLLALSLQGQIVTMMAQPTEAWKLTYTHPVAKSQVVRVLSFDPIDSYSDFAPDYKVTELIPRVSHL